VSQADISLNANHAIRFVLEMRKQKYRGLAVLRNLIGIYCRLTVNTAVVADLRYLRGGGDFGNPTRTEGVWAYGVILCICELGRRPLRCKQERETKYILREQN